MAGMGIRGLIAASTVLAASSGLAGQVAADEDRPEQRVRAKAQALIDVLPGGPGVVAEAVVNSPYSASDPQGDAPAVADILEHSVKHTATKVKLDVRVRQGTDPFADPNWTMGYSGPFWVISTDGDTTEEYFTALLSAGDHLFGAVLNTNTEEIVCDVVPKVHGGNGYKVKFPLLCLGLPPTIRVRAAMSYDKPPYRNFGNEDPFDITRLTPEVAAA